MKALESGMVNSRLAWMTFSYDEPDTDKIMVSVSRRVGDGKPFTGLDERQAAEALKHRYPDYVHDRGQGFTTMGHGDKTRLVFDIRRATNVEKMAELVDESQRHVIVDGDVILDLEHFIVRLGTKNNRLLLLVTGPCLDTEREQLLARTALEMARNARAFAVTDTGRRVDMTMPLDTASMPTETGILLVLE